MPTDVPILEAGGPAATRNPGGYPWRERRRFMWIVIAFCMATIAWALFKDSDTAVMQSAVTMGFTIMGTTVGSYVFGAVWEDKR